MDSRITAVIGEIKDQTGIDITVYDMLGEKVAATASIYSHAFPQRDRFNGNIFCDKTLGLSYFLLNTPYKGYLGVISGSDAAARNYAFLISAMIESAVTHTDENLSKSDSIKQILLGETTHANINKIVRKFPSLNLPCYVLCVYASPDKIGDVYTFLEQLSEGSEDNAVVVDEDMVAYLRSIGADADYQSALEFAEMVWSNIMQELHISTKIGIGSFAKSAYELAPAYYQGNNAVRMGIQSTEKSDIFSYKEFIMVRMIEDIPKSTLSKYLEMLLDSSAKDILKDGEMLNTAEEFLANSLNISETARNLFMHRNTLMYRLDKIEKAMGLNIRRFSDAVTFRIILILYRHLSY